VEKSTSLASPPLVTYILSSPPFSVKEKHRSRGNAMLDQFFSCDGVLNEWGILMEMKDRDGSAGSEGGLIYTRRAQQSLYDGLILPPFSQKARKV
jgi:hypothetical protein